MNRDTLGFNVGLLVPGLIVGLVVTSVVVTRINDQVFRHAVIAVIVIAGSVMLFRELGGK
ncbi:MAG: hypothetical protein Ct9H300mP11_27480 [Chloroflexota bacterium]|nr:MAG: hypothetical protein Ct9H300mP11_27480 [Chloroflexota bacterium]